MRGFYFRLTPKPMGKQWCPPNQISVERTKPEELNLFVIIRLNTLISD